MSLNFQLDLKKEVPFIITSPHSGERVPESCTWLHTLPEEVLMCDVDRYVDRLYEPAAQQLKILFYKTEWHRYAVDLNRIPEDIDCESVEGNQNPAGKFNRGYHWVVTTHNERLLPKPLTQAQHQDLTDLIYTPFHQTVKSMYQFYDCSPARPVFHLDAHSMPSKGTSMHRDPGETRADIVVSDSLGKSCHRHFRDLVIAAYAAAGFKVRYNWPYFGGRLTEQYGQPHLGQQAIQVELNRALYMDEVTKKIKPSSVEVQQKVAAALKYIKSELPNIQLHG